MNPKYPLLLWSPKNSSNGMELVSLCIKLPTSDSWLNVRLFGFFFIPKSHQSYILISVYLYFSPICLKSWNIFLCHSLTFLFRSAPLLMRADQRRTTMPTSMPAEWPPSTWSLTRWCTSSSAEKTWSGYSGLSGRPGGCPRNRPKMAARLVVRRTKPRNQPPT